MADQSRRAEARNDLLALAVLLNSGCDDYLKVFSAWKKAEESVTDFLDNPDWLEKWVNDIEKVEVRSE